MKWLASLFSSNVTSPIKAIGDVIDELHTSEDEKNAAQIVMQKLAQEPAKLQAAINQVEASHRSRFVAGWRPFIGWVCGFSLGAYFIPQYIMAAYIWSTMILAMETMPETLPPFPVTAEGLFELTLALLGMGTIRMVEKLQGRTK